MHRRRSLLVGASLVTLAPALARAQETTCWSLGTATPGWRLSGLWRRLRRDRQRGRSDAVHPAPQHARRGSTENIPLIEAGQLDIALVTGEPLYEAVNGIGRAPAKLTLITAMYSTPGMFVVRGDSPHRSIADLVGKPVAFGAQGSGLVILARYVLDGLGYDIEKDFQARLSRARRRRPDDGQDGPRRRSGAAASAGPASRRWPPARAAASSRPMRRQAGASSPSTRC